MELTKQQIQFIDNRLKSRGIKYWDIRVELIDHIVSDIEDNCTTDDFEEKLKKAFIKRGSKNGLYKINEHAWKNTNRLYRKKYSLGILIFFKSFKNMVMLILLFSVYYFLSNNMPFVLFKKLSHIIFILPIVLILFLIVKNRRMNFGRSVNMDYGVSYLSMAFLILQAIPIFFNKSTPQTLTIVWLIVMPIYYIATYSGYLVYRMALDKIKKLHKQYQSL